MLYDEDNLEDLLLERYDHLPLESSSDESVRPEKSRERTVEEKDGYHSDEASEAGSEASVDAKDSDERLPEPAKAPKKPRAPVLKIDESLLIGSKGLAYVLKNARNLNLSDDSEMANFKKLMTFYRSWTHLMFPKLKNDAVIARVEKLCR